MENISNILIYYFKCCLEEPNLRRWCFIWAVGVAVWRMESRHVMQFISQLGSLAFPSMPMQLPVAFIDVVVSLLSVKQSTSHWAMSCTKFRLQRTEIAFTRLLATTCPRTQTVCPHRVSIFIPFCWLQWLKRKQQLHTQPHTHCYIHTYAHSLILALLNLATWPQALIALITW